MDINLKDNAVVLTYDPRNLQIPNKINTLINNKINILAEDKAIAYDMAMDFAENELERAIHQRFSEGNIIVKITGYGGSGMLYKENPYSNTRSRPMFDRIYFDYDNWTAYNSCFEFNKAKIDPRPFVPKTQKRVFINDEHCNQLYELDGIVPKYELLDKFWKYLNGIKISDYRDENVA